MESQLKEAYDKMKLAFAETGVDVYSQADNNKLKE